VKVIQVENLSKLYRLGQVGTGSIFHDVNRWWHTVRGKEDPYMRVGELNDRTQKGKGDYVWALKDINFDVQQGEVLGIIGRNGAGKSTLLKILSRTTAPTTGSIKVKGRIASLLEVGTGFHPELSGRDNIFMNGTILGMTRAEIKTKFDEIVQFAGIERYLDTPVKRYSSGMYVRLAFAVAAHLESEILIVDEVLAVGDIEFQKKCLGKMKDVSEKQGRTVLFVSHNMQSIASLSSQLALMTNGSVFKFSDPYEGINLFQDQLLVNESKLSEFGSNFFESNNYLDVIEFYLADDSGEIINLFKNQKVLVVILRIFVKIVDPLLTVGVGLYTRDGINLFWSVHLNDSAEIELSEGIQQIKIYIPIDSLNNGEYQLELICSIHNMKWIYKPRNSSPYLVFSIFNEHDLSFKNRTRREGCLNPLIKYVKEI
jgi:lipopolysaccharide transport system ATP-binding protein